MYWIVMQSNLMLSGDIDDVKDLEIVFCGQDGNVFIVLIRNSGQTSEAIEWRRYGTSSLILRGNLCQ